MSAAHPLRRSEEDRQAQSATALELFYDLIFYAALAPGRAASRRRWSGLRARPTTPRLARWPADTAP